MSNPTAAREAVNSPPFEYKQDVRPALIEAALDVDGVFRKTSRILAVRVDAPFKVATDRGVMEGKEGDWLVTNHPEDDLNSDVWSISDERMLATYENVNDQQRRLEVHVTPPAVFIRHAIAALTEGGSVADRHHDQAVHKLEEALLWLNGPTVLGE